MNGATPASGRVIVQQRRRGFVVDDAHALPSGASVIVPGSGSTHQLAESLTSAQNLDHIFTTSEGQTWLPGGSHGEVFTCSGVGFRAKHQVAALSGTTFAT
jgi:hypothetical protein